MPKVNIKDMISEATKVDYIVSSSIENYSLNEIKKLSELARENDLLFSIKEERSNSYQGIMINLIRKSDIKEHISFIDYL